MAPLLAIREPSRMDPAAFRAEVNDPDLTTLVALDGRAAACVLARRVGGDTAYLSLLFVHPELRRRTRLALFILKRFLGRLLERGIDRMTCEVSVDNAASLAFADGFQRYADHRAVVHIVGKALDRAQG
jgi:ribosomal protein S18 acetylase RimI-like enzyme